MALVDIQSHPAGRAGHGGGRGPEMVLGCLPENDLVCQAYAVCRYHMHARCIMIHRRVSQIHYGRSCIICYMNADDDHSDVWNRSVPFVSYNIGTFTTDLSQVFGGRESFLTSHLRIYEYENN